MASCFYPVPGRKSTSCFRRKLLLHYYSNHSVDLYPDTHPWLVWAQWHSTSRPRVYTNYTHAMFSQWVALCKEEYFRMTTSHMAVLHGLYWIMGGHVCCLMTWVRLFLCKRHLITTVLCETILCDLHVLWYDFNRYIAEDSPRLVIIPIRWITKRTRKVNVSQNNYLQKKIYSNRFPHL